MSLASDPVHSKSSRRMGPVPRPKNALKNAREPVSVQKLCYACYSHYFEIIPGYYSESFLEGGIGRVQ